MPIIKRDNCCGNITRVTLTNESGAVVQVLDFGARLYSWKTPDKNGKLIDVVLGYDTEQDYQTDEFWLGGVPGRMANRIKNGKFELDGKTYQLECNHPPNHLHGGPKGFAMKFWTIQTTNEENNSVTFSYESKDGEEGYPGNLHVEATYQLTNNNELVITFSGTTDAATPVMLTSHGYFNLNGEGSPDIDDHVMHVFATKYLPTDENHITTGEILPVDGTVYDFRTPKSFGAIPIEQRAFDACYCLAFENDHELRHAARMTSASSGLQMDVWTDQCGLQFYNSGYLQVASGKGGKPYAKCSAFCFETHGFPDAVNHSNYPSIIVRPNDTYKHTCIYKIGQIGPVQ